MDSTLKEINVRRSVRKFWTDGLSDASEEFPVSFGELNLTADSPAAKKWMHIQLNDILPAQVSTALMTVFFFAREDEYGDEVSKLRDKAIDILYPGYMGLYETEVAEGESWYKVGGIKTDVVFQSKPLPLSLSDVRAVYIEVILKWGAVW